jgi:hypothetical protein
MKKAGYFIVLILLVILLTFLTQIGGIVLLLSELLHKNVRLAKQSRVLTFLFFYIVAICFIVPVLAKPYGRVPLPVFGNNLVKPVSIWTCVLNRHYVRPVLKESVAKAAIALEATYQGAEIRYLDANFPFFDGFPLLPHLSHSDGKKLDIAFFYREKSTQKPTNDKPSRSGYGVFTAPKSNERNRISECLDKGYWQYDFNKYFTFGSNPEDYEFDQERTRALIMLWINDPNMEKMFIEPHLEARMGLAQYDKVRLHGCQAVRHDDHLHIQIF